MEKYNVKEILSEEIVVLESENYGVQIWSLSNLTKKHKGSSCHICGKIVGDKAYRPATNLGNRMERICINCIKELNSEVRNSSHA